MGHSLVALATSLVAVLLVAPAAAADADPERPPHYRPPVQGPVIDPFRPPATPYGPGNRGLEYATIPGEEVAAPADGVVTFAGAVGGGLHVVVLHADGIRTSLSFLAAVLVVRGQQVAGGQTVGRAGATVHLGARRGAAYLDPATLFAGGDGASSTAVLVPDGPDRALGVEEEVDGLRDLVAAAGPRVAAASDLSNPAAAAARAAGRVADLARLAAAVGAPASWAVLASAAAALAEQGLCTPPSSPPPPRPGGRRLLVLVGGLGSSSAAADVFRLDAAALGYRPDEVVGFSYRGGTTGEQPYEAADTLSGIEVAAARLAALLTRLAEAHPRLPIDVVAHSMGGVVARAALTLGSPAAVPPPATLVTLGTPHRGAGLAAVARLWSHSPAGWLLVEGLAGTGGAAAASRSVQDLAPGSGLLRRLAASRPPGPPTRVSTVGARTDLFVPPPHAGWPGVPGTTVDVASPAAGAHAALPGSAAATREVALAVGGAPPTCRSQPDVLADAAVGATVQVATSATGAAAGAALAAVLPVGPVPVPRSG